jgi:hypothetical protein
MFDRIRDLWRASLEQLLGMGVRVDHVMIHANEMASGFELPGEDFIISAQAMNYQGENVIAIVKFHKFGYQPEEVLRVCYSLDVPGPGSEEEAIDLIVGSLVAYYLRAHMEQVVAKVVRSAWMAQG